MITTNNNNTQHTNDPTMADDIMEVITDALGEEFTDEIRGITTFEEAGILGHAATDEQGLIISMEDRSEFQIKIRRTK